MNRPTPIVASSIAAIAIALTPVAAMAESTSSEDIAAVLYSDLNEAVVAEDWQQAIATIDRLIADDPVRAAGLGGYREMLVARANAQTDDVPTLPILEAQPAEDTQSDVAIANDPTSVAPEPTVNSEKQVENAEQRDRDIERRVVRAGDRIGRRYSRDYREARFWVDLFRE